MSPTPFATQIADALEAARALDAASDKGGDVAPQFNALRAALKALETA